MPRSWTYTAITALALALLGCGGGGDGSVGGSTVLAVVEIDQQGSSAFAAQSMSVTFGARTPVDDFAPVPGFPIADLTSVDDYTTWEAPTDHPLFATTAAALTDGLVSDMGSLRFGALNSWFPETASAWQILVPNPAVPDLNGHVVDRIVLVVDEVTIDSPGQDPNADGEWVDFELRGRFLIYGR